ncbi:glycosyltransferase WbuB [Serinicoccus sp. CUA-874]|uniref:glycosyltransferase family 4 protein n=1 Tax=Serinicoccus sp. CUA-874 TaxID=1517939 RepID=UPI00095F3B24|nr:glycosyltransferase WbuB [Serinicoccus sp. CUA-874]
MPLDRRVWLECQALRDSGYEVSVICPQGPGDPTYHVVDGVALYKYPPAPEAEGLAGFAYEFAYSWIRTALLSLTVRRERGFDVIQACNPPDTFWLLALLWKARGVRFVFDHHDLNPELFLSRFGAPTTPVEHAELAVLRWLERCTFRTADHVISTNESFKEIAQERGGLAEHDVTVVRSGPDTRSMYPRRPDPDVRGGASHLLAYLGIMGPQDGVESVLHLMDELVHRRGRTSVRAVLLGFGDSLESLRQECTRLDLDDHVEFTGRVGPDEIARYLNAADVGLGPDPRTPMNDLSTMNKTMEYMAFGLPSVAFDLKETRISGADSVLYVPPGDIGAFADAVEQLLDDDDLRAGMAVRGRRRAVSVLDWRPQRKAYLRAIGSVLGRGKIESGQTAADALENELGVPTDDETALTNEADLRAAVRRSDATGGAA